ncbi:PREDICTED: golgin subfamily A member 6-like protein 22 isoform X3 [Ipomoea nil]|uniref:golgin subfamily A member 6-like protein 22 isoform X3 n=1 Tax=Ipomoea nil TaxID=35883 RepID=UPI000901ED18|nr:PREDICTED: golgin subfamily A member 6-like protein 22 isoform X3 [Ipomoea nil]
MEEEKKKRKNKKKKNKQNRTTENASSGAGQVAPHDQNHVSESQEDTTDTGEMQNNDAAKIDRDPNRHLSTNHPTLAEGDKQYWMGREAIYEEKIKQLENEKNVHVQKESKVEERIRQLENEKFMHIHKGASLEEKNLQLQKEKDILLQQMTVLEVEISQLQNGRDFWLQKEAGYEERISLLVDEAATLNLKRVRLEEKIKQMEEERDAWIQKENLMETRISSLNTRNAFLQTEVKELVELRNSTALENQLLKVTVNTLQSQVQGLEKSATSSSTGGKMHTSENGDVNSEAAHAVVQKLLAENSELVEKVNELYIELQRRDSMMEVSSFPMTGNAESTYNTNTTYITNSSALGLEPMSEMANGREITSADNPALVSKSMIQSTEDVNDKAKMNSHDKANAKDDSMGLDSSEVETSEIVQIPLDETEAEEATESEIIPDDQKTTAEVVPLSDAPLIGAPFRLISFMARYVSGADLVDKNSATATR